MMETNGHRISIMDGSWELRILVTDLQVERSIRVQSDLHVGGVMIKLVDELGKTTHFLKYHSIKWNDFILQNDLSQR